MANGHKHSSNLKLISFASLSFLLFYSHSQSAWPPSLRSTGKLMRRVSRVTDRWGRRHIQVPSRVDRWRRTAARKLTEYKVSWRNFINIIWYLCQIEILSFSLTASNSSIKTSVIIFDSMLIKSLFLILSSTAFFR